jgi:hypothetical protein
MPALLAAQAEMKAAKKDSVNPHYKSHYADLESVIEAVKAPLNKNGIVYMQTNIPSTDGLTIETTLIHTSGEYISSSIWLPVGRNDAQAFGSAQTYGRRYGLQSICGLAAADDDGNDAVKSDVSKLQRGINLNDVDRKNMIAELKSYRANFTDTVWQAFFPKGKEKVLSLSDSELKSFYDNICKAISDMRVIDDDIPL